MPVKRCGPLKLVKRKKENPTNRNDENCYSSPTKKMKSVYSSKAILNIYDLNFFYNLLLVVYFSYISFFLGFNNC